MNETSRTAAVPQPRSSRAAAAQPRGRTLLSPFLHVGSAAYGATVCSLLEGFAFAAQLVGTDGSAGVVPAGGRLRAGPPTGPKWINTDLQDIGST